MVHKLHRFADRPKGQTPAQWASLAESVIDSYAKQLKAKDGLPDEPMKDNEDLSLWFGLSYSSFAVLPRVFMEAMPDAWQRRMALLLNEADEAFPGIPVSNFRVQAVEDGKLMKMPPDLINYRHPDHEFIERCRKAKP